MRTNLNLITYRSAWAWPRLTRTVAPPCGPRTVSEYWAIAAHSIDSLCSLAFVTCWTSTMDCPSGCAQSVAWSWAFVEVSSANCSWWPTCAAHRQPASGWTVASPRTVWPTPRWQSWRRRCCALASWRKWWKCRSRWRTVGCHRPDTVWTGPICKQTSEFVAAGVMPAGAWVWLGTPGRRMWWWRRIDRGAGRWPEFGRGFPCTESWEAAMGCLAHRQLRHWPAHSHRRHRLRPIPVINYKERRHNLLISCLRNNGCSCLVE